MKEEMDNMTAYIRYRLEKAEEVYQAACIVICMISVKKTLSQ